MRRCYAIIAIVFGILFIGTGITYFQTNKEVSQVQIRCIESEGSESIAENVKIGLTADGSNHCWNISGKLNSNYMKDEKIKKDQKYNGTYYISDQVNQSGFYTEPLDDLKRMINDIDGEYRDIRPEALYYNENDPSLNENYKGFVKEYKTFAKNASEGESSAEIKLNTLMDYYPIGNKNTFMIPRYYGMEKGEDFLYKINYSPVSGSENVFHLLNDRFRIPVQDDEYVRFEDFSERNLNAKIVRDENSDAYLMKGYNAINSEYCYFTFDTYTEKGKVVDTSELKDGYGIYRVPLIKPGDDIKWVKNHQPFDIKKLSNVLPMDPKNKITGLGSADGNNNLIVTYSTEEDENIVACADCSKHIISCKTNLPDDIKSIIECKGYDEFTFVTYSDESDQKYIVVYERKDNLLEKKLISKINGSGYVDDADYDGTNIITIEREKPKAVTIINMEDRIDLCDFMVNIYNKDGNVYYGRYTTSLTNQFIKERKDLMNYRQYAVFRKLEIEW